MSEALLWYWALMPWAALCNMGVLVPVCWAMDGAWPWEIANGPVGSAALPVAYVWVSEMTWVLGMHSLYMVLIQARIVVRAGHAREGTPIRALVVSGVMGATVTVFAFFGDPLGVVAWVH